MLTGQTLTYQCAVNKCFLALCAANIDLYKAIRRLAVAFVDGSKASSTLHFKD